MRIVLTAEEIAEIKARLPAKRISDGFFGNRSKALREMVSQRVPEKHEINLDTARWHRDGGFSVEANQIRQIWVDWYSFTVAEGLGELHPIWQGTNIIIDDAQIDAWREAIEKECK